MLIDLRFVFVSVQRGCYQTVISNYVRMPTIRRNQTIYMYMDPNLQERSFAFNIRISGAIMTLFGIYISQISSPPGI